MRYIKERREALGGSLPARSVPKIDIEAPPLETSPNRWPDRKAAKSPPPWRSCAC
jgi:hypothetical protein